MAFFPFFFPLIEFESRLGTIYYVRRVDYEKGSHHSSLSSCCIEERLPLEGQQRYPSATFDWLWLGQIISCSFSHFFLEIKAYNGLPILFRYSGISGNRSGKQLEKPKRPMHKTSLTLRFDYIFPTTETPKNSLKGGYSLNSGGGEGQ